MNIRLVMAAAAATLVSVSASAQTVYAGRNILGSSRTSSGFIPPDTMGAVGRDHFVELINGRYATYRKSDGVRVQDVTLNSFFTTAGVTPTNFAFDPRVLFDPHSNRWFAMAVDNAGLANRYLMAVSIDSDPTAGWRAFAIDSDANNDRWADFPTMGMNGNNVVLATNMFGVSGASTATAIVVIDKAGLLTTTPGTAGRVSYEDISSSNTGFTVQPVWDIDNETTNYRMLSAFTSNSHRFSTVNGNGAAATLSFGPSVAVPNFSFPPTADQPGTKANISTGDNRFSGSVIKNGNDIWAVQCVNVSDRAALRWLRYNATTQALVASGTISDPSLALFFPSLAVNDFGQIMIGFSSASPTQSVSASYVVGTYGSGAPTFGTIQSYRVGISDYEVLDGSGRNRWGDYSATNADPADPSIFWTIQEYVSSVDNWSTRIGEFILPRPGEARWASNSSGTFLTAANWFAGSAPAATDTLVFSRSTTPDTAGYTVTFPSSAATNAAALLVHQGTLTLNLAGSSLNLTSPNASLVLGQYAGAPSLTIRGGVVSAPEILVAPSPMSPGASLSFADRSVVSSERIAVGGTMTSAGGIGNFKLGEGSRLVSSGIIRVYPGSVLDCTGGQVDMSGQMIIDGTMLAILGGGHFGHVSGGGTLNVQSGSYSASSLSISNLFISAAALTIPNDAPPIQLGEETFAGNHLMTGGNIYTGNNSILVDYSVASPISLVIADYLRFYFIPQESLGGLPTFLAIAEAVDLGLTTFNGVTVDDTTVIAKYTYVGDANLDGQVDALDYERVDLAIGNTGVLGTAQGDLNYDGNVDALDYEQIDLNIGNGVGSPLAGVFVPEPTCLATVALFAIASGRRRRRDHKASTSA